MGARGGGGAAQHLKAESPDWAWGPEQGSPGHTLTLGSSLTLEVSARSPSHGRRWHSGEGLAYEDLVQRAKPGEPQCPDTRLASNLLQPAERAVARLLVEVSFRPGGFRWRAVREPPATVALLDLGTGIPGTAHSRPWQGPPACGAPPRGVGAEQGLGEW